LSEKQQPTFFVSALTDIDALHHYCACLTFSEDIAENESLRLDDGDDVEQELSLVRYSKMYAAKSLVLVSRFDYFETFRVRFRFLHLSEIAVFRALICWLGICKTVCPF